MEQWMFGMQESEKVLEWGGGKRARLRRCAEDAEDVIRIELSYDGAYGMGERFDGLNQKGNRVENVVVEKFCHQGEHTYCTAPFFVTDTGFGLYADTLEKTVFMFEETISCRVPRGTELHLFAGTVPEAVAGYMDLFGPARLPPRFAFGVWISANRWNSRADVEHQLACLEKYGFPASVLVLEAWSDEATFYIWNGAAYTPRAEGAFSCEEFDFTYSPCWKDPKEMIHKLHEKGIRLVLWQIPVWKKQDTEIDCLQAELDEREALEKQLCVRLEDGSPYRIPEGHWFAGSLIPDFTKEETKKIWFAKRQYLLDMGVDGFKTDGGEFIYRDDLLFADGLKGTQAKNRYAQSYTEAYTAFIGEGRVLFSRAGCAGAHRTPIHWGGDQQSENEELKSVLRAGLSAAMTGIPFWGFDIAGFAGPLPSLDLYRRATQLACFCPVMQWHSEPDGGQFSELLPGGSGNNERSPWNLAESYGCPAFLEEMRFWHCLRMKLIPYLYSTAMECCEESRPMMRPLVYEWPQDPEAAGIEDEYMLGEALLVAPLLEEESRTRQVYFPEGEWYGLFSRSRIAGNTWRESGAEEKAPVYLRSGTALALQEHTQDGLHFLLAGERGEAVCRSEEGSLKLVWSGGRVRADWQGTNGSLEKKKITWELL